MAAKSISMTGTVALVLKPLDTEKIASNGQWYDAVEVEVMAQNSDNELEHLAYFEASAKQPPLDPEEIQAELVNHPLWGQFFKPTPESAMTAAMTIHGVLVESYKRLSGESSGKFNNPAIDKLTKLV